MHNFYEVINTISASIKSIADRKRELNNINAAIVFTGNKKNRKIMKINKINVFII